jgi:uncharacterized protein (DUF1778 family)
MAQVRKQDNRLDVRISEEDKELIETAARLKGQKMSAFVIENMRRVSNTIIETEKTISLTDPAWDRFVDLVTNPPEPTTSLVNAFKKLKA